MRDSQRSRVYAAESSVGNRSGAMSLDQCQEYVESITRSAWWRHRSRLFHVEVVAGARGGRAWATYGRIRTSPGARTKMIMLHELAHILNDAPGEVRAPHGPEFCANFVALTRQYLGQDQGDALREAFRERKVRVRGAQRPKVRRVHCSKCGLQFAHGGGWKLKGSAVGSTQFCTKRCGVEWFSARLAKVG